MTLAEIDRRMWAHNRRAEKERVTLLTSVWLTASLIRRKRLPSLNSLLTPETRVIKKDSEEKKALDSMFDSLVAELGGK